MKLFDKRLYARKLVKIKHTDIYDFARDYIIAVPTTVNRRGLSYAEIGCEFIINFLGEFNECQQTGIQKDSIVSKLTLNDYFDTSMRLKREKKVFNKKTGMLKKSLAVALFALVSFTSCEPYYCEGYDDCRPRYSANYDTTDAFYADKLLGTWQCEYPFIIGNTEFKQIKFFPNGKCDITMAEVYNVDWYTETYSYTYYGNTIRFSRNGSTISFMIKDYICPQLFLRDSFGTYVMRLVKAYGC